jgi:SAM-dependent methyltransferase
MSGPATTDYEYIGDELEVFALATNWKRYFASLLAPHIRGRVLEVGAGIGETTKALHRPGLASWTCLEPDARLASKLEHLRLADGARPEVVVGDVSRLDAARRFDTIVYIDVLEHIADDAGELRRASARLAPGGALVVLSPAFPALFSEFDRAIGHERRYTRRSLAAAYPRELRRESLFYADCVGAALSLANRVLLRESMPTAAQVRFWDRVVVPISRVVDPLVGRAVGRSVIAVYTRPEAHAA